MANIPTIPGSARVQDQSIGVKANAAPTLQRLQSTKQAIGAATGAVTEALQGVVDYEERKQKAEEVAAFNQANIIMRQTTDIFSANVQSLNYKEVVPEWQKQAQQTREAIMDNADVKGAGRIRLSQALDAWQGQTTGHFQIYADVQGSSSRWETAKRSANSILASGKDESIATASKAIDATVRAGDASPEMGDQEKNTFPSRLDAYQAQNMIGTNSYLAQKQLTEKKGGEFVYFKNITLPEVRDHLIREADAAVTKMQNGNRDGLLGKVDDNQVVTEQELKSKEKVGDISPEGANSVRRAIKRDGLAGATDVKNQAWLSADDHDLRQDKSPDQTVQKWKDANGYLPLAIRKPLFEHFDTLLNRAKKADADAQRPVESQTLQLMREDRRENGLMVPQTVDRTEGHLFWKKTVPAQHYNGGLRDLQEESESNIKKYFGPDATKAKVLKAEQEHFAEVYDKMRKWFADPANVKASAEDAETYRQHLEAPWVMGAASAALANPAGPATSSEDIEKQVRDELNKR